MVGPGMNPLDWTVRSWLTFSKLLDEVKLLTEDQIPSSKDIEGLSFLNIPALIETDLT
jgi:hypothetical protein